MKKILFFILTFLLLPIIVWSYDTNWTLEKSKLDNNETSYTLNYTPSRGEPLVLALAKIDKAFSIRIMTPFEKCELQDELKDYYERKMPKELKRALASSGNMHNPAITPLQDNFAKALKQTSLYKKLEKKLGAKGYWVDKDISFEKFSMNKHENFYLFYADIWLEAIPFVDLVNLAKTSFPNYSQEQVVKVLKDGLWSWSRDELVVSLDKKQYLFMKNKSEQLIVLDLTKVEQQNIGKIGPNRHYERVETKAVRWVENNEDFVQIEFETKAWSKGKRYRASELLIINRDAKIQWR